MEFSETKDALGTNWDMMDSYIEKTDAEKHVPLDTESLISPDCFEGDVIVSHYTIAKEVANKLVRGQYVSFSSMLTT